MNLINSSKKLDTKHAKSPENRLDLRIWIMMYVNPVALFKILETHLTTHEFFENHIKKYKIMQDQLDLRNLTRNHSTLYRKVEIQ